MLDLLGIKVFQGQAPWQGLICRGAVAIVRMYAKTPWLSISATSLMKGQGKIFPSKATKFVKEGAVL